jgi:hypothetical protein
MKDAVSDGAWGADAALLDNQNPIAEQGRRKLQGVKAMHVFPGVRAG